MILNIADMTPHNRYKVATATILPRPIAWVSTADAQGNYNVAPYSFFTVASSNPLILMFCPQQSGGQDKDTLRNAREIGEFVVNIVNADTAAAMNLTATSLPPGQSEFEHAGLTPVMSETVNVPRVGEAPVAFECKLEQIVIPHVTGTGGGAVVMGRVTAIYIRDDIYVDGYVQLEQLQPIGRLMGNKYLHVADIFELIRE